MLENLKEKQTESVEVINAGVGGWGTLQSLIRFLTWGPLIKPDLTIIYQSKNDLTFYHNANPKIKKVFPDYSNIITQFGDLNRKYQESLLALYGPTKPQTINLDRYKDDELNGTLLRYRIITELAEKWNGNTLFIPEVINGGRYKPYMNNIQNAALKMLKNIDSCKIFIIENLLGNNNFLDKMHFSAEGCSIYASLVSKYIISNKLLNN